MTPEKNIRTEADKHGCPAETLLFMREPVAVPPDSDKNNFEIIVVKKVLGPDGALVKLMEKRGLFL